MKWRRLVLGVLIVGKMAAPTREAAAQEATGYAADHFNPSERGSQWFVLDSLDLRGDGRIALGAVTGYSYRSVVDYRGDGSVQDSIVRNQVITHLGASFFFADRVRIGLSVPLQLFADGHTAHMRGLAYPPPSEEIAVGDVRIGADVRLGGQYGDPFTAALGAQFFAPSGNPRAYTGDGEPRVLPHFLFSGLLGAFAYSGELGLDVRGRDEAYGDGRIGTGAVAALAAGFLLADRTLMIGPEVFGSTVVSKGVAFENRTTPIEALFGLHYDLLDAFRIGAGAGAGLTRSYGAPVARALLSLEWVPKSPNMTSEKKATADRDSDGVPDCEDACSFAAGPQSNDPFQNGCPPTDADKDGIADAVDACPLVPGVKSDDPKGNGCPADADKDGIADKEDACPTEPGMKSLDPKKNGCPERDADGDGVLDDADACPNQAGIRTNDPKTNGCPDPDLDKDGIPNDADACPNEPGKPDPDPKKNGCPKAFLQGGEIKITDQVKFKTASSQILPGKDSEEVLQAVLAVIKAHPEIKHLRVEGHTDNVGNADKNKKLSLARADAVIVWLTGHGIDKGLLVSEGFGQERPIDTNATPQGRTNNRRVEFHVISGEETP